MGIPDDRYPKSRDVIASKNLTILCSDCFIFINVNTKGFYMMELNLKNVISCFLNWNQRQSLFLLNKSLVHSHSQQQIAFLLPNITLINVFTYLRVQNFNRARFFSCDNFLISRFSQLLGRFSCFYGKFCLHIQSFGYFNCCILYVKLLLLSNL